jgi:hypothetical protein
LISALVAGWFLVGLAVGALDDLTLGEYLIQLFLPSLPAFLDGVEVQATHRDQAEAKHCLELEVEDLLAYARDAEELPSEGDCRRIQDRNYVLRRTGPQVPQVYYRLRREEDEAVMQAAAEDLARQLPPGLRRVAT